MRVPDLTKEVVPNLYGTGSSNEATKSAYTLAASTDSC